MRLIDADALKETIKDINEIMIFPRDNLLGIERLIEVAPTVDAVEVVRCKDCEFYVTDGGALMICDITNCIVIDDDYCGYGRTKRKEGVSDDKSHKCGRAVTKCT